MLGCDYYDCVHDGSVKPVSLVVICLSIYPLEFTSLLFIEIYVIKHETMKLIQKKVY